MNDIIDTSVEALFSSKRMSGYLYSALKRFNIEDLKELEGFGLGRLRMVRGFGKVLVTEVAELAEKTGVAI